MLGAPKRALGWHCKGLVSILYTFCKQIFIVESDTDPPPPAPAIALSNSPFPPSPHLSSVSTIGGNFVTISTAIVLV